mgnify:CR=1 FL=1
MEWSEAVNNKMEIKKSTLVWVVIGVLFLAVLFLTYKVSSLTGNVVTDSGKLDTTGWTENEKMNYEMHGTIPARAQGSTPSTSAGSGMVGGC